MGPLSPFGPDTPIQGTAAVRPDPLAAPRRRARSTFLRPTVAPNRLAAAHRRARSILPRVAVAPDPPCRGSPSRQIRLAPPCHARRHSPSPGSTQALAVARIHAGAATPRQEALAVTWIHAGARRHLDPRRRRRLYLLRGGAPKEEVRRLEKALRRLDPLGGGEALSSSTSPEPEETTS